MAGVRDRAKMTCPVELRGVSALLEMQEILPLIERYAQELRDRYPRHTLIPNSIIGVAGIPVFGYDEECKKILQVLEDGRFETTGPESAEPWNALQERLSNTYKCFCNETDNEILWFGWTYWHPLEKGPQRRSMGSLSRSRKLSAWLGTANLDPIVNLGQRRQRLAQLNPFFEKCNATDDERLGAWGKWVWKDYFHSIAALRNTCDGGPYLTLNDYFRSIFEGEVKPRHGRSEELLTGRSFAFVQADDPQRLAETDHLTCLTYTDEEVGALWDWAMKPFPDGVPEKYFLSTVSREAVERLRRAGDLPRSPLLDALERTRNTLGLEDLTHAYVILQHLTYYQTLMQSPCQYSLLVPSARYLCIMMIGTSKALSSCQVAAWRGVAVQLFNASTVQHFASLEAQRREWERMGPLIHLLSHGLTKAFTTPLLNLCDELDNLGMDFDRSKPARSSAGKLTRASRFLRNFGRLWGDLLVEITPGPKVPTHKIDRGITIAVGQKTLHLSPRFSLTERVLLSDLAGRLEDGAYDTFEFLALNDLYDDKRFEKLRECIESGDLSVRDLFDVTVKLPSDGVRAHEAILLNHLQNLVENSILALDFAPVVGNVNTKCPPPLWLRPWVKITCEYPHRASGANPEEWFARISICDSGIGINEKLMHKFNAEVLTPCNRGAFLLTDQTVRERLRKKEYSTRSGAGLGQAWVACAQYLCRLCLVRLGSSSTSEELIKNGRGRMELPKQPDAGSRIDLLLPAPPSDAATGSGIVVGYEEPGIWQQ